jgi:hypothetical protein
MLLLTSTGTLAKEEVFDLLRREVKKSMEEQSLGRKVARPWRMFVCLFST